MLEVSEYFERLDVSRGAHPRPSSHANIVYTQSIQSAIRSSLAHIRHARIAPSAINAPAPGFVPPSLGVGLPNEEDKQGAINLGFQEARVERDAWKGILAALTRLKASQEATNDANISEQMQE